MTRLIKGLVYIEFLDIKGVTPTVWLPEELDEQLRVLCGIKAVSLLTGEDNHIPKSLITIPFPSRNLKAIIKFIKWKDQDRRGEIGQSSLFLLFNEADDAIFYKAQKYLEEVFNELIEEIIYIEKHSSDKLKLAHIISEFQTQIDFILTDLKQKEISKRKIEEFPSLRKEGALTTENIDLKLKTIVCGDPMVGKTSIILRLTDDAFTRTYLPTLGVNISEKMIKIDGNYIQLVFWDLAGQSKFNSMRIHYYQGAEVVLLVFDLTNKDSFKNINKWYEDIQKNFKNKKELIGFLIGNKNDLNEKRLIEQNNALELAEKLNLQYFETSALTGENIQDMFEIIGKKFLEII